MTVWKVVRALTRTVRLVLGHLMGFKKIKGKRTYIFKRTEVTEQLRALAVLPEDPSIVLSTHQAAHSSL